MGQNLILDSFPEKLRNMRLNNLTAKQIDKTNEAKSMFSTLFGKLCYSFFGLSNNQLNKLSNNELKELDRLIVGKAWPWAISQMLFTFCVPIFGWITGLFSLYNGEFASWTYLHNRKRLKKIYGKEFLSKIRIS